MRLVHPHLTVPAKRERARMLAEEFELVNQLRGKFPDDLHVARLLFEQRFMAVKR